MDLFDKYNDQNIFLKIIAGEIPCYKIFETSELIAFLDLFPESYGHTLVIPKKKFKNIIDVDSKTLHLIIDAVQQLSNKLVDRLKADGVKVVQYNGKEAGQTIFHLHFHIIPAYKDIKYNPHFDNKEKHENLIHLQETLTK